MMRGRVWCMLAIGFATIARAQPPAVPAETPPSQLETEVLATLNHARADPASYGAGLQTYRGFFHARIVVIPGAEDNFETEEGVVPVDEAIAFLGGQATLGTLQPSPLLALTAADHVRDQANTGGVGHFGSDGSTPGDRAARRGGGKGVAEVIAYGALDAADVVRQLVIDDGVADRGHRMLMFSSHLRYAGVACGPHPEFRSICVIDMADTPDGKVLGGKVMRVAQRDSFGRRALQRK